MVDYRGSVWAVGRGGSEEYDEMTTVYRIKYEFIAESNLEPEEMDDQTALDYLRTRIESNPEADRHDIEYWKLW